MMLRNRTINAYFGVLVVTVVGSLAASYLLYLVYATPFEAFSAHAYEIRSSL